MYSFDLIRACLIGCVTSIALRVRPALSLNELDIGNSLKAPSFFLHHSPYKLKPEFITICRMVHLKISLNSYKVQVMKDINHRLTIYIIFKMLTRNVTRRLALKTFTRLLYDKTLINFCRFTLH